VRVLIPTENRRLNEMVGFVGITVSVLIFLALVSYNPHDASFNVSAPAPDAHSAVNWIGPVGAYGADLLFQFLGYAVFLLPVVMFTLAWRWFRSQPVESPVSKIVGCALLGIFTPALLALWHWPEVRGAIPPGGMFGHLVAGGLLAALNTVGANVVAMMAFPGFAVSHHAILVHRRSRMGERSDEAPRSCRTNSRSLGGLARSARTSTPEKTPGRNQVVGRQPIAPQAAGPGTLLLKSATAPEAEDR
jgi:hypothetical protein